jgi:hypothetical protein
MFAPKSDKERVTRKRATKTSSPLFFFFFYYPNLSCDKAGSIRAEPERSSSKEIGLSQAKPSQIPDQVDPQSGIDRSQDLAACLAELGDGSLLGEGDATGESRLDNGGSVKLGGGCEFIEHRQQQEKSTGWR